MNSLLDFSFPCPWCGFEINEGQATATLSGATKGLLHYTRSSPLLPFCAVCSTIHWKSIIGTSLDNRPIGPTLGESLKDGYIMFTHFGRAADDWCISDQFAFMALTRNMAIACRERIKSVDLCIPIHFGKEERLWPVQYSYLSRTRRRMCIIAPISTLVRWTFLLPSKDQSST